MSKITVMQWINHHYKHLQNQGASFLVLPNYERGWWLVGDNGVQNCATLLQPLRTCNIWCFVFLLCPFPAVTSSTVLSYSIQRCVTQDSEKSQEKKKTILTLLFTTSIEKQDAQYPDSILGICIKSLPVPKIQSHYYAEKLTMSDVACKWETRVDRLPDLVYCSTWQVA